VDKQFDEIFLFCFLKNSILTFLLSLRLLADDKKCIDNANSLLIKEQNIFKFYSLINLLKNLKFDEFQGV